MHRLTFWFPLLFLSFYLSISSPFAFIVVCLLFEFFFFFFFFFFFSSFMCFHVHGRRQIGTRGWRGCLCVKTTILGCLWSRIIIFQHGMDAAEEQVNEGSSVVWAV